MRNSSRYRIVLLTFIFSVFIFLLFPGPILAQSEYNQLDSVLDTFIDSRKTRELKEYGSETEQKTFIETLEREVYRPVDEAVIDHLKSLPEYEGKKIITHDFRTPGVEGMKVNTDRDVRVLVEVEPDRWLEVSTDKWEDIYYREFADRTGFKPKSTTSYKQYKEIKEHAARFRQSPTDRFHLEATRDYSDQYGEATPRVVKTKKGLARLHDPQGLALMYIEKADEQLRRAAGTSDPDLKAMYETEALMQLKKGVTSIEEIRQGYQKQGYYVGELPDNFKEIAVRIKEVEGTGREDLAELKNKMQEYGFYDSSDFKNKLGGQIESLKMVTGRKPPGKPIISKQKAMKAAGIIGDITSIEQSLEKAARGNHLLFNFEKDDSTGLKVAKGAAIAAVELLPVPVIDAAERGWQVDEEEKRYLESMIESGKEGGWEAHPVTSMARVTTKIVSRTVASMTIDPIKAGVTATSEGVKTASDIYDNFIASFSRKESERLQQAKRDSYQERKGNFHLGSLRGYVNKGRPLTAPVKPGDLLSFNTLRNEDWKKNYLVRWELVPPGSPAIRLRELPTIKPGSEEISFELPDLPPAEYKMRLRIFDRKDMLQADYRELTFNISDYIKLGEIEGAIRDYDGEPLKGEADIGDVLAFRVKRSGNWNENYNIEWLLNGIRYKYESASNLKIHRLKFTTDELEPGNYKISIRILSKEGNIIDHKSSKFKLIGNKPFLPDFKVKGRLNDENGPLLADYGSVQNGDILYFSSRVKGPGFKNQLLEEPETTRLFWQVYDSQGRPVPGLKKEKIVLFDEEEKLTEFRFRPDRLANGKYKVGLTHLLVSNSEVRSQAVAEFELYESIFIKKIVATDRINGQKDKKLFYPDQRPIFYVYYDLAKPGNTVDINIDVYRSGGDLIDSVNVKRPGKGETPPYRVGYQMPECVLSSGQEIVFEISINDGKNEKTAIRKIQIQNYQLKLELPDRLKTGEQEQFRIIVPDKFQKPYQVDINVGKGLGAGYQPGALQGTLDAIVSGKPRPVIFAVKVTDARGIAASAQEKIIVEPPTASAGSPQLNKALVDAVLNARGPDANEDNIAEIGSLLEKGASPNSHIISWNGPTTETVLHRVAGDGSFQYYKTDYKIANMLLEYGADVNMADTEEKNQTPLHYAAYNLNLQLVELFIDYGADPNFLAGNHIINKATPMYFALSNTYSSTGDTPAGIREKQEKALKISKLLLKKGADVNLGKGDGLPLRAAVKNFNPEAVKLLLDAEARYDSGLLNWITEEKLDRAKTAAGKLVAGGYNKQTELFALDKFAEIERILHDLKAK